MLDLSDFLLLEGYVQNPFAGFIIMDEDSKIVMATPLACKILDTELKGRRLNDFIVNRDKSPHGERMDLKNTGKPKDAYVQGKSDKGEVRELYTCARFPFQVDGVWYQGGFLTKV